MLIEQAIPVEYVAGFLDGEGSIVLRKDKKGWFLLQIQISNTHEGVLHQIASTFGGAVSPKNSLQLKMNNFRPQFTWSTSGQPSLPFLQKMLPFVIIKREHVELAIEFLKFCSPGSGRQLIGERKAQRVAIFERFKKLNQRGKQHKLLNSV